VAVDFHLHSTASDGLAEPGQVVEYAVEIGLSCISLTDHNTCNGIARAAARAAELGLRFIPGIEFTSLLDGREIHIIAYFIDPENPDLLDRNQRHRMRAVNRLSRMIDRLNNFGMALSIEEVLATAGNSLPGRPHLARVMVAMGLAQNTNDAFDRWLNSASPVFEVVECETPEEIYQLIAKAGGIGGPAHPGAAGQGEVLDFQDVSRHRDWGAQVLEVFHPSHDRRQTDQYLEIARKLKMAPTGGSDFHSNERGLTAMVQKICPKWVEAKLRAKYEQCHSPRPR
jgi:3',5'-nucleoside bisphosphate phosphatase